MNAWQADEMWETESGRLWEDLNAPDPCEGMMMEAAGSLQVAINHLDTATDWVTQAASDLMGTPMEDVVGSFTQQMEGILAELKQLREKYGRGER